MAVGKQNGSTEKNGEGTFGAKPHVDIGIAVRACNPDAIPRILGELLAFRESPSVEKDDTRLAMLVHARALVRALETPRETMIQHNWAQVCWATPKYLELGEANSTSQAWLPHCHYNLLQCRRLRSPRKRTEQGRRYCEPTWNEPRSIR